jgi:hypothetical protein
MTRRTTPAETALRAHYAALLADRDRVIANLRARLADPAAAPAPPAETDDPATLRRLLRDATSRVEFLEELVYADGYDPADYPTPAADPDAWIGLDPAQLFPDFN